MQFHTTDGNETNTITAHDMHEKTTIKFKSSLKQKVHKYKINMDKQYNGYKAYIVNSSICQIPYSSISVKI